MNQKKIFFAAWVTALIGAGLGWIIAYLIPTPYTSSLYQGLDRKYAAIGAVGGLLFGASQEALRQMKEQRDKEVE
ncbi:MAG TPA: hypothetical protein V6C65_20245 [Allocoleopsis sp.]